jgi:hypothetical protein
MALVLVNDLLKLSVLATNLSHVLWVESHLFEIYENAPAPVLQLFFVLAFDLDPDKSARLEERADVFWESDDLVDLGIDFVTLIFELFLLFQEGFVGKLEALVFFKTGGEFLLDLREDAFVLELVEALHDNVLRPQIFHSHHVKEHIVAQMERGVKCV